MNNEREILLDSVTGIIYMQPTNDIFYQEVAGKFYLLNKLRVKNIEYDKCKFIFKLKYFVCVSCRA